MFIFSFSELSSWINAQEALKKALYNGSRILSLEEPNICLAASAERTAGRSTQGEPSTVWTYQVYLQWNRWQMRWGLVLIEQRPALTASCLQRPQRRGAKERWGAGSELGVFFRGMWGHLDLTRIEGLGCIVTCENYVQDLISEKLILRSKVSGRGYSQSCMHVYVCVFIQMLSPS